MLFLFIHELAPIVFALMQTRSHMRSGSGRRQLAIINGPGWPAAFSPIVLCVFFLESCPVRCCNRSNPLDGQTAPRLWPVQLQPGDLSAIVGRALHAVYGSGRAKACRARESSSPVQLLPFKGRQAVKSYTSSLACMQYCTVAHAHTPHKSFCCSTLKLSTEKRALPALPLCV
jgi:hypothetical protein